MARMIRMTPEIADQIRKEFDAVLQDLQNNKAYDGDISYKKKFDAIQSKAELKFTELAYLKMIALVREFDKEVAWHGVAKRGDDPTKDEYIISDILVYPQIVTSANVETDQAEYEKWLMEQEDEVFNNIRMQGHSHVNMGTTPSAIDNALYKGILAQLEDDMFYIFLIWNKRNEKTIQIFDMKKNIKFETADITVSVMNDATGVDFIQDAKAKVQDRASVIQKSNISMLSTTAKQPVVQSSRATTVPTKEAKNGKQLKKKKATKKIDYGTGFSYTGDWADDDLNAWMSMNK